MNKFKYLLIVSISLSFLISCNKDEEEDNSQIAEPKVFTLNALIGTNGGINLSGNYISNGNEISEVGFAYSIDSLFSTKIILNSDLGSNDEIEYFLANGMEENVQYFYKAFVKSSGESFFGNIKTFISDGSVAPEINSISNDFGHISDTLEIYGKYFEDNNFQTFIDFSNINAQIISLNDTIIKCKVPANITNIISDIRVRIDNRADTYSSFTLFEPTIETIDPIVGVIGDTLSIDGNHFDLVNLGNKVFFGNIQSTVIESNRNNIKVVVPESIESPSESVLLNAQLQDVSYNVPFKLSEPEINSISPLNATFRDELTITGNNFDFKKSRNKVYFGNIEATITYADRNTLKVIVPDDLESSSEPIKVIAQLQEVVFNENFQLIPPEISFVPQDVYANQNITIKGAYFHPILDKNNITIEEIEANLISGNTENLDTKIPLGPFPRRKANVKIQLLDLVVEYGLELNILDKWVMVSDNLPLRYYDGMHNAVVANNSAYIITKDKDFLDETSYLWKFIPEDFSWEQYSLPFNIDVYEEGGIVESDGDNIYVYLPNNDNDFWKFNSVSSTWSKKAQFIGAKRAGATHFSINGEIYIGLGVDFEPYTPLVYEDFYKYNTSNNTWVQIADVPFDIYDGSKRTKTGAFVIGNIGYFTGGAFSTGDIDCWSYNSSTNIWNRIANFESPRNGTSSFELNGLGYITGGSTIGGSNRKDSWTYNPSIDSWTQIDDVGHIERGGHFSFVLNGKAYVGGGGIYDSGGSTGYDFYEFIP